MSGYVRKSRPSWKPAARAPAPPDPTATIFCSCGVDIAVTWTTRAPIACFGCGRTFEAPPHVDAPPRQWRPERALVALPLETPRAAPSPAFTGTVIALLLGTLAVLGILVVRVSPA